MAEQMDRNEVVLQALNKTLPAQTARARENFERLRRVHPEDTPTALARRITMYYLSAVTTSGGATGAARTVPGAGVPAAALDLAAFTQASASYVLTLAELHGLHPEDVERRRFLVRAVLLGDSAVAALSKGADAVVPHWGRQLVEAIPMPAVDKANALVGRHRFVTKYGEKQGVLVLSKHVPVGIGIGVGAVSNHLVGWTIVGTAKKVFGPAPEFFEPWQEPLVVDADCIEVAPETAEIDGDAPR
jgi:hypothetical protein